MGKEDSFFLGDDDDNAAQQNGTDIHPRPRQADLAASPLNNSLLPLLCLPVLPSCPAPVGISPGSGRQWAVVQVEASTTNRAASPPPAWFIHHHSPPRHMEADVPIAAATPRSASAPIPPLPLPLFLLSTVTSLLKICQRSVLSLQLLLVVLQ